MGYAHIDNLYRNKEILLFRECWAMEKIHGTSAHIKIECGEITFFSGGAKLENFVELFDQDKLWESIGKLELEPDCPYVIYGEAYGGKVQGMRETYGPELSFIAFDVKIGHCWLSVPDAREFATELGIEFVYFERTTTDIEALDRLRDGYSEQSIRNGCGDGHKREGIVLRPLIELRKNNNARICAKHKREDFQERKTKQKVTNVDKLKLYSDAHEAATEFCTPMRLVHVLQKFPDYQEKGMEITKQVIEAMVEDIEREAEGEIIANRETKGAIGRLTAHLYKEKLKESLQ